MDAAKGKRWLGDVKPHEAIVKALSHPSRAKAQAILSQRIVSPTEIAQQLDVDLRNLSHHMRILEEFGVIESVEEEQVRRSMAHYFKAVNWRRLENPAWKKLGYDARPATARPSGDRSSGI